MTQYVHEVASSPMIVRLSPAPEIPLRYASSAEATRVLVCMRAVHASK